MEATVSEEGRVCTGCEQYKTWDMFYLNGKQRTRQSKCRVCWLKTYANGHQRELMYRYDQGDEQVGVCLCGRMYSIRKKDPSGRLLPATYTECTHCRRN